ncbi:Mov34/MPN/PAD-1 family protein [Hymenobacter lucidus]|uniref:Mov34/MPN/PAD-1 family protein n=1 Tax=Hymenobacter lucidus TaxID=2880930 RepID=A0ABS8AY80_9BACT|nr:Mov34/MPN/PAD-1 family protein [Hymenobacter lucidus]
MNRAHTVTVNKTDPSVTIWLPQLAYIAILEEAITKMPCETGGILIGYWGSSTEVVVTAVVGPGPKAIHKKRSFRPDNAYHEQEIARLYTQSGRTETYLGDWHTHPAAAAYMSFRDELTLRSLAEYKQARLTQPLMLILGTQPLGLQAWAHTYRKAFFATKSVYGACSIIIY